MSARLSPDGLYYWDGQQWLSTLSPDGRYRWNGSAWIPAGSGYAMTPTYQQPGGASRVPTSWTRPLQFAVAGWYGLSAVYTLTLPLWLSGPMSDLMNQSIQRQQTLHPNASPPPPELTSMVTSFIGAALWVSALFGLAIALVAIIGALNRWTWVYYAVLVLLGFGLLAIPSDIGALANGSTPFSYGFVMPTWLYWTGLAVAIPDAALFIVMLYALVTRGPWGMTKQLPAAG